MNIRPLLVVFILFILCYFAGPGAAAENQQPGAERVEAKTVDLQAAPDTTIPLTRSLFLGLNAELEHTQETNFDLDRSTSDNLGVLQAQTSVALAWLPSRRAVFFTTFDLSQDFASDQKREEKNLTELELNELNLTIPEPSSRWKLEAGRVKFKDDRQWLYDEGLDGLRFSYRYSRLDLTAWAARKNDIERFHRGEDDSADYYELRASRAPDDEEDDTVMSAYALVRKDREGNKEDPVFLGVHLEREPTDAFEYWLDLARAAGRSAEGRIEAFGLDIGAEYKFQDIPLKPAIIFGYAYGSGDSDPADGRDGNFRQTGLQDNEGKLIGVSSIEYYGVLFQPELSNLRIVTAGIGIRPRKSFSLELMYHSYQQDKDSVTIRDSELGKDPSGLSRDLGHEIDLVGGYKTDRVKAKLAIGYFKPGAAFADVSGRAHDALFTEFTAQYEF